MYMATLRLLKDRPPRPDKKQDLFPRRAAGGRVRRSSLVLKPSTAQTEKGCWTIKP